MRCRRSSDALARCVASGVAVGLGAVAADAAVRHGAAGVALAAHLRAAVGLYVAVGAGVGLAAWAVVTLVRRLTAPLERRAPRAAELARAAAYGALAIAALSSTAFWAFSGRVAHAGALGTVGPYVALAAVGLSASTVALFHGRALRAADAGRAAGGSARAAATAAALAILGAALVVVDLTVLVAIYRRLHTALELCGAALLGCASFSGLTLLARRAPARTAIRAVAVAAAVWTLALASSPWLRGWHQEALAHTGRDPVYVGRMLRRIELAQAALRGEDRAEMRASRLDELRERYDVDTSTRDPRWDAPWGAQPGAPDPGGRALAADFNVLVYYVDSLRRDVAYDEEVMPNAAALSRQGIRFDRAYSTGSDTLRALPGILGGSYDGMERSPGTLLDLAKRVEVPTTLFIPASAADFISRLLPAFAFDETYRLSDHARGGVWGYGADQPTAGPMVDHVLSWLAQRGSQRFFAWLFNFDVHNWHELDGTYVDGAAERYNVPAEGRWNWRYRVVARSLDEHLGRLLRGLEELDLADRTVVIFVADHGEALGYRGFWPHSTFLWESLLRVPLVMRVPGVPPVVVDEMVSLIDVAPTMARLLTPDPPMNGYHGEDLLGFLDPEPPPRRLPLLAAAVSEQQIARVGILDERYKLVLPLEWGAPELYDLTAPDPDEVDVSAPNARETLRLMGALLRSPVFLAAEAELERAKR
ncbi:sulfatase-like hydrolase/transferase [Sorangium sp. So ce513]|uniref:sulfatase-like hydrolase/transferase n=1 Tax=Sorangium sp. So ce513 TaxID=3133315 RepID=UPI003F62A96D